MPSQCRNAEDVKLARRRRQRAQSPSVRPRFPSFVSRSPRSISSATGGLRDHMLHLPLFLFGHFFDARSLARSHARRIRSNGPTDLHNSFIIS
eukprot:6207625-Pleurochrysis_carterae.AAC.1